MKSEARKEEVMNAIKECAAELGRAPTVVELLNRKPLRRGHIYRTFGNYRKALDACALEGRGPGFQIDGKRLFLDWAGVVRRLGRLPAVAEYDMHGEYSAQPLITRYRSWKGVPAAMQAYAREAGLAAEWADVMEIVDARLNMIRSTTWSSMPDGDEEDETVFGTPLTVSPLTYAPTCENAVMFLFGALARDLGFAVEHIRPAFPDCIALREVRPGVWRRVKIEFEQESRNFLLHGHAVDGCHMIVCWVHNWAGCPLEVIELRKVVEEMNCPNLRKTGAGWGPR